MKGVKYVLVTLGCYISNYTFTYRTVIYTTGNSLSSPAFYALKVLEDEKLADNAAKLGKILRKELNTLDKLVVKDVRGKGLFNAVEIHEMSGWCWFIHWLVIPGVIVYLGYA